MENPIRSSSARTDRAVDFLLLVLSRRSGTLMARSNMDATAPMGRLM